MTPPQHRTSRWLSITLAATAGLVTLACGEQKPGAAPPADPVVSSRPARATLIVATPAASDSAVLRLAAATDTTLAGTRVALPVAHVQSVMSDRGFWIGLWGQQVYVFQTGATPTPVQGGEAFAVSGTVRAAPRSAQTAPRGMAPIDIEALHAQQIYIAADSVAVSAAR